MGDDEAQYVCKTCKPAGDSLVDSNEPPDWLDALLKLRLKGFQIIMTSIISKKYSAHLNQIDGEELRAFYERHQQGSRCSHCVSH